jgi:hypothetical protein
MENLIDIAFKANLISIVSYYLIFVLVKYFTHDERKVITRHFQQELFFQFFNAYLTAIFSNGRFLFCIISGVTYALFQNLISALLNIIIDRASIGEVIKFYHRAALGDISNKFTTVIYIIMVISLSILGYYVYCFITEINGLWKGISTFFLKQLLAFKHTGIHV